MSEGRRYRAAVAALDALYAELPTVACRGLCGVACGPIPLAELEARRLQVTTHRKPRTIALTPHVDASGNTRREQCVYLSAGDRCTAYAVRPLLCRAFGVVKRMSCMHGCIPDRWLSDVDLLAIAQAVERVGGRLLVTEPAGVARHPAGGFLELGADAGARRPVDVIEADAERTRGLRALHGGRIIAAVSKL